MGFKSTGLDSRFQCKNRFWKLCSESRDISQNVSNFAGLVWKADFVHLFGNILGLCAYSLKPIFAIKPRVQAGRLEYHEPYNPNDFFLCQKKSGQKEFRSKRFGYKKFLGPKKAPQNWVQKGSDPFISEKKNRLDYRVHGIQNDRLGLTVSTQKSVLKTMHRVPRYRSKCIKFCRFGLEGRFCTLFW